MSHSRQLPRNANLRPLRNQAKDSIHKELRHRGEPVVAYPDAELWNAVGGSDGVAALIKDLYRRIELDELLRAAFPHFNSGEATPFFMQWFGGSRGYSDDLAGGLLRRHQHRYISPKAAAAWLRCMREAVAARGLNAEQIMRPLARIAKAMIHSPETEPEELCKSCDAIQDVAQVQFETLLNDAAKGRTENVRKALEKNRTLASRRGMHNRTLAWVATYQNRAKILELVLKAGGDCNTPACDPMRATMACDHVQMGTGVAVTPLAIAKKWHPALVAPLMEHGAIDDVFTAAWLGDLPALRGHIARHPELVHAFDPADDFKEVSLLCHAVCGGSIDAVTLLLERGAEVKRHSGKLLTPAVVMNRVDLVKLLIEHGADVERAGFLGRLDDAERPVADLLIAHGKKVPDWMLPRACRPDVSANVATPSHSAARIRRQRRRPRTIWTNRAALRRARRQTSADQVAARTRRASQRAGRRGLDAALASVEDALQGRSDSGNGTAGRKRRQPRCPR
jgi:truncated hemoglobin YjbI